MKGINIFSELHFGCAVFLKLSIHLHCVQYTSKTVLFSQTLMSVLHHGLNSAQHRTLTCSLIPSFCKSNSKRVEKKRNKYLGSCFNLPECHCKSSHHSCEEITK